MKYQKITIILFLIVALLPIHNIFAQAKKTPATTTEIKKTTVETPPSDESAESIKNIGKTIEEYTPEFIAKRIIWIVEKLEKFRLGNFNSGLIFYPALFIFLFFSVRYLWRRFF